MRLLLDTHVLLWALSQPDKLTKATLKKLSITGAHAAKAADLAPLHTDPFDRLLAAQAAIEPLILITNDRMLEGYGSFVTLV